MAQEASIEKDRFYKSLEKLEILAKGQEDGQEGTGEEMNKSQICTGPGNEPQNWPGGEKTEFGDNWSDSISENGTDYTKAMRKSIMEKVAKGIPLNAQELSLLKGDMEKGCGPMSKNGEEDEKEEKEKFSRELGKSLDGAVKESETLQKGIEVSEFLSEFTKAFGSGLEGVEARTTSRLHEVAKSLMEVFNQFAEKQGEFNKSLADAVVNIGHGLSSNIQQVAAVAEAPAGPPKSQMVPQRSGQGYIQKSFDGPAGAEGISKSMVLDRMVDMVEKGKLSSVEVVKYESTGSCRPDLYNQIVQEIQAGR